MKNRNEAAEKELKKLKQELLDYAYHSAHEINGPLARIEGLSSLFWKEESCDDRENIVVMIENHTKELKLAIRTFNELLNDRVSS